MHGRNLSSALMRSRFHNRNRDRGGESIRLALAVGVTPVPPKITDAEGVPHPTRHAPRNVCFAHRDRWDEETGHVSIFRKPANE
jgi:hypothetical protein